MTKAVATTKGGGGGEEWNSGIKKNNIFILFYLYLAVKEVFWAQFFDMEIFDECTRFEVPCIRKSRISDWSMCIYYQHNSKTNYSKNIKFGILHFYHIQMLLETFHKDRTKTLCTGAHKKILIL